MLFLKRYLSIFKKRLFWVEQQIASRIWQVFETNFNSKKKWVFEQKKEHNIYKRIAAGERENLNFFSE